MVALGTGGLLPLPCLLPVCRSVVRRLPVAWDNLPLSRGRERRWALPAAPRALWHGPCCWGPLGASAKTLEGVPEGVSGLSRPGHGPQEVVLVVPQEPLEVESIFRCSHGVNVLGTPLIAPSLPLPHGELFSMFFCLLKTVPFKSLGDWGFRTKD